MSETPVDDLRTRPLPFAALMGVEIVAASPDRVEARLPVRQELCTIPDIMHGGAIMALADTLGGVAGFLNLEQGQGTTTIESKTNFMATIPLGDTAHAVCEPVHKGRKLTIWQTKVSRGDGRLAAIVIQTQLVL